jgi:hypothetical protein
VADITDKRPTRIIVNQSLFNDQGLLLELRTRHNIEPVVRSFHHHHVEPHLIVNSETAVMVYPAVLLTQSNDEQSINDFLNQLRREMLCRYERVCLIFEMGSRQDPDIKPLLPVPAATTIRRLSVASPFVQILLAASLEHVAHLIRLLVNQETRLDTEMFGREWLQDQASQVHYKSMLLINS